MPLTSDLKDRYFALRHVKKAISFPMALDSRLTTSNQSTHALIGQKFQ